MAEQQTTLGPLYNGERALGWHTFRGGRQFGGEPKGTTVSEALADMSLDFTVSIAPLTTVIDGVPTSIPGKHALVRNGDRPSVYGIVGPVYNALQNSDVAKLLDPLTETYGLDTVASGADGRDLLVVLKTQPTTINGDEIQEYLYFLDSKDGIRSVQCALTPVRLYCTNQLVTGLKAASFSAQVKHIEGVAGHIGFNLNIMQLMEGARRQLHETFEAMGKRRMTQEEIDDLLTRVFPEPSVPRRVALLHTLAAATQATNGELDDKFRETLDPDQLAATDQAQSNYESNLRLVPILRNDARTLIGTFNDQNSAFANTGWAVYNAIVELADFRGTRAAPENTAKSALFGDRAREKERAFAGVMNLIQPGFSNGSEMAETIAANTQARQALRDRIRQAAIMKREQTAVERYTADVASGKVKGRYDEAGNLLPPPTAEERLEASIQAEEARIVAQQKVLDDKRAVLQKSLDDKRATLAARRGTQATVAAERTEAEQAQAPELVATAEASKKK